MATFLNEIDMIYCLCIPDRKEFVVNQFTKLGFSHKLKIIDAFTPNSSHTLDIVNNHFVYPIYTNNMFHVANTLGLIKIMNDIVLNKFNYAMIIEDDVIFLEEMFSVANKWINKETISRVFNINKPYTLYLQSTKPESFYQPAINDPTKTGIVHTQIKYGEPASLINYIACELLLKHMLPITSPFDECKFMIKRRYKIQQGILVPYICRELSKNAFSYNTKTLGFTFKRSASNNNKTIYDLLKKTIFHITTENDLLYQIIVTCLIKCINPDINIIINGDKQNSMEYNIGKKIQVFNNSYLIGSTITESTPFTNNSFIISVRGQNSYNIIMKKIKMASIIGDFLLLFSKFYKKDKLINYKYCFIYDKKVQIKCDDKYIVINPNKTDIMALIDTMCQAEYIITDNISFVTIAHSYSINAVLAYLKINQKDIICDDYYSAFGIVITPLIFCHGDEIELNKELTSIINEFAQPQPLMIQNIQDKLADVIPFNFKLHSMFKNKGHVQFLT